MREIIRRIRRRRIIGEFTLGRQDGRSGTGRQNESDNIRERDDRALSFIPNQKPISFFPIIGKIVGFFSNHWKLFQPFFQSLEKLDVRSAHFFQSLETFLRVFPIIGKAGRALSALFPIIGNFFSRFSNVSRRSSAKADHWKKRSVRSVAFAEGSCRPAGVSLVGVAGSSGGFLLERRFRQQR